MKALILAAGYGTRMYPLTKACPKPLLLVGARPILDYALEKLVRLKGLREAIIVTNDKFFLNFKNWAAKSENRYGLALKVLNDGTKSDAGRLGAIGDINFALSRENAWDDLIIFGGDNLFEDDLSAFLKSALKLSPAVTI
ncbi:MAG TPA: sugar phosphate nucleotidyltransferase, partial [Candidatus Omnitrophota bacterium]|nr:sugar phosphate nucleotidyltransferase [Candidatus Omnitrophota bacterium]